MIHSFHRRLEFGKEKHKQNFPNESDGRRWKDESKQTRCWNHISWKGNMYTHYISALRFSLLFDSG